MLPSQTWFPAASLVGAIIPAWNLRQTPDHLARRVLCTSTQPLNASVTSRHSLRLCPHSRTHGGYHAIYPSPPTPLSPPPSLTGFLILPTHHARPDIRRLMEHSRTLWNTLPPPGHHSPFRSPRLRASPSPWRPLSLTSLSSQHLSPPETIQVWQEVPGTRLGNGQSTFLLESGRVTQTPRPPLETPEEDRKRLSFSFPEDVTSRGRSAWAGPPPTAGTPHRSLGDA